MAFPEQSRYKGPAPQSASPEQFSPQTTFQSNPCQLTGDPYAALRQPLTAVSLDSRRSGVIDDAINFEFRDDALVGCVSVAHVAARIERGSALERSILRIGRSVFNGDYCAVSLFPRDIYPSEIGLALGQVRPTVSCELFFDSNHNLYDARFFLGATKLMRRYTYADSADLFDDCAKNQAFREGLQAVRRLSELRMRVGGDAFLSVCDGHIERVPSTNLENIVGRQPGAYISAELMIIYNYLASRMVSTQNLEALFRYSVANSTRGLSRTPSAHEGLGLDSYMRVTSPCRNAEDYVNQAILTAAILGQQEPFCSQELDSLAEHLAYLSKGLKGRSFQTSTYQPDFDALQWRDFDHAEFSEQLKNCSLRQDFSLALRVESLMRIAANELCVGDLQHIIISTKNCGEEWNEVREAAVEKLKSRPQTAVEILERAGVTRPYALLRTEILINNGQANGCAVTRYYFEGPDLIESPTVVGSNLQDVISTASLNILSQIADGNWGQKLVCENAASDQPNFVNLRGDHTHRDTPALFDKFVSTFEDSHCRYTINKFRIPSGPVSEVRLSLVHSKGELHSRTYRAKEQALAERAAKYELLVANATDLLGHLDHDEPDSKAAMKLFQECERAHLGKPQFTSELCFPDGVNTYMERVYAYVSILPDRFLSAGPIVSEDRKDAKQVLAQELRAKIFKYWGGHESELLDWAALQRWLGRRWTSKQDKKLR